MYLLFFMMGLVTMLTEHKVIRATKAQKIRSVFTYPLFMITYCPIAIAAIFIAYSAQAQIGIMAGLTSSKTDLETAVADVENINQYHIGIAYKFGLGNLVTLQPAILYNVKGTQVDNLVGVNHFAAVLPFVVGYKFSRMGAFYVFEHSRIFTPFIHVMWLHRFRFLFIMIILYHIACPKVRTYFHRLDSHKMINKKLRS